MIKHKTSKICTAALARTPLRFALHVCMYLGRVRDQYSLHSRDDARILIPAEQRILAAACLRVLDVGPALHEVLVGQDTRQLARHGAVHVFHDGEVGREEDVEVAL